MSTHAALHPRTPVVVAARRTPVGTQGRSLATVDVATLAASVLKALRADLSALGVDDPVADVVLGNTRGPGGNIARVAVLAAGLGVAVPGMTVDRQCGSGQAAIQVAADQIRAGQVGPVLAGGAESASTQPTTIAPGADTGYHRAPFAPAPFADPAMGPAAQDVADRFGIDRAQQDAYAARSHRLTLACRAAGDEHPELVPILGRTLDDRPRPLKTDVLQRLPGAFRVGGSVTAGNSCGVSDGAAAVAVISERRRVSLGLPGLALLDWTVAGVDPGLPGIGPVPAVNRLLARAGIGWPQVDVLEITEAFAAQVLACTDAWGLDPLGADTARVCPQGGAIARGHPWGASGALLVVRLFSQLVRLRRGTVGIATCAIGGGQGVALLARRVDP